MKIQFTILKNNIKNNWYWFLILFVLTIISLAIYLLRPSFIELSKEDFISLTCYPVINFKDYIGFLLSYFTIIINVYIIYLYYNYELEHTSLNIFLRIKDKNWLIYKMITLFIFIVSFRTIYVLLLFIPFINKIPFDNNLIFNNIMYFLSLSLTIITLSNFLHKYKILNLILSILLPITLFHIYNK
ncbi:MAG: hypothetical protein IJZ36_04690, partial [Bacilli bacterium]|nr:hypothetical protein [Bacilli bacterium]